MEHTTEQETLVVGVDTKSSTFSARSAHTVAAKRHGSNEDRSRPRSGQKDMLLSAEYPCIGRQKEAAEIAALLADPACRLVTLVGPGGIGKTTLALHIAHQISAVQVAHSFHDGTCLVALQPVQTADLITPTIAAELGLSLTGSEEPLLQVCHYLQEKELLLILDNFEHLLAGVSVLTTLLDTAPAVKLMVTSREALNLREEWLYPIQGLTYPLQHDELHPDPINADSLERYSAIQLFTERARRVRPTFALADEVSCVIRICQLVGGMPLALELAATWVKSLPCIEICTQIEQNLDFLTARLRNVPHRHHSVQAVFDTSWSLLPEVEQAVFARLCVFRGGFTAHAASSICKASLTTLLSLVDKSLLRQENNGRYRFHELLRQYAQAKLEQSSQDAAQIRDAHCTYFTGFLYQYKEEVVGEQQGKIIAAIEEEIDNIRAAWQWAIDSNKSAMIPKMMQVLIHFYQIRSRYREGADVYAQAISAFEDGRPTREKQIALIVLYVYLGWLYIRLGELDRAGDVLQRCQALYAELDLPPLPGYTTDPDAPLGLVYSIQGNFVDAIRLGEQSLQRNATYGHRLNLLHAHYVLIGANLKQGAYVEAHQHAQKALAITQEIGDRWFMATCLIELGQIEEALGNYALAERHFCTSFRLREELGDPGGMAVALNHLGQTALRQKNFAHAQDLYEQSRTMCADSNDRGGLATALEGLGTVATALGAYADACQYYQNALQLAVDIPFVPLIFSLFLHIGELFLKTGNEVWGSVLLTMTRDHPASACAISERAEQLLVRYQDVVSEEPVESTVPWYPADSVEAVASLLLVELMGTASYAPGEPLSESITLPAQQDLVEPLTARELEILHLLAQGLTNQEIAEELIISIGTIKAHNHSIFGKLGVNNRTSAVARARDLELV